MFVPNTAPDGKAVPPSGIKMLALIIAEQSYGNTENIDLASGCTSH